MKAHENARRAGRDPQGGVHAMGQGSVLHPALGARVEGHDEAHDLEEEANELREEDSPQIEPNAIFLQPLTPVNKCGENLPLLTVSKGLYFR